MPKIGKGNTTLTNKDIGIDQITDAIKSNDEFISDDIKQGRINEDLFTPEFEALVLQLRGINAIAAKQMADEMYQVYHRHISNILEIQTQNTINVLAPMFVKPEFKKEE